MKANFTDMPACRQYWFNERQRLLLVQTIENASYAGKLVPEVAVLLRMLNETIPEDDDRAEPSDGG